MSGHGHGHDHDHGGHGRRALAIALLINTVFFVFELAGALYAGSLALLADAIHMLTDSASLGLALLAAWVATRPADEKRTYGYQRTEVLAALANGLLLVVTVGYILYEAVGRFRDPPAVQPEVIVVVGLVGLAANLAAAYVLMGDRDNLNVRGAFLHLIADAGSSVATVLVGVALLYTDYLILDPLFAVLISAVILYSTRGLLGDSLNILLQGTPGDVDVGEVRSFLADLDGVEDVHDVHVWALSSNRYALSAHLVVREGVDSDAVLERSRSALHDRFGVDHATIQTESPAYEHPVEPDCYDADGVRQR
ncbi:cation diffusion facilitator family transporter [Halalkalicoccus tibetensis]|uniref:Cation diffusion facilitator family transporter n=1 Tax=Halalkalicoccus tibetensis TaxID=175632 RepID=A0ABD5V248_9EURY